MSRFVIHRHEVPSTFGRPSHWDVMLEEDAARDIGRAPELLTWSVERLPTGAEVVPARRLNNHRHRYLDYEGPVSGGRGSVCRWDAGTLTWIDRSEDLVRVHVVGTRWVGMVSFCREPADESPGEPSPGSRVIQRWLLEFAADD